MQELLKNLVGDSAQAELLKHFNPDRTKDPEVIALIDEKLNSLGIDVQDLKEKQPKLYEMIHLCFTVNAARFQTSSDPEQLI